ncbi:glycosyltransferase family 4 protein [Mobilicoccus caccae]|uniref:Glycosyltransferase subfamily 4-like N-terminal domain-containing protein n=1 Tax=Mobilicoccus caccae TaxID=1859295 RepID=A0ABQ6IVI5_9MICO|nr:glycosyltransferase family 4 protein [Mobilicoccus caccae]GMA40698.1 hypothetical protein GCM10025883_27430 [Mobilicoccus caccae]
MRVFVELAQSVDPSTWAARNAEGLAADASPYGLHHLERFGHQVRFCRAGRTRRVRRLGEVISARFWGLQPVYSLLAMSDRRRRSADVVLCMDERNGIPATFMPLRTPVVTGVAWLEDPGELDPLYRGIARAGLRRAAGVFVECSAMIEPLTRDFGVSADKVHFIHFGIDERHFYPSEEPPIPGRVFSVGDDRMRDYDTLIGALEQVRRQAPSASAEVATTMPVEFPDWVTVHRRRMDDAVRECYQRASLVALALRPTRQGSGLTVILEAMASGRPIVATSNPGLDDYIADGETGILVPPGDRHAMAEAIGGLLEDPARARAMGQRGRNRIQEHFTTRHMAGELAAVLRKAVGVTTDHGPTSLETG